MIYAMSDLHLSFSTNKPMAVFGPHWENHHQKIKENWVKTITEQDAILIPGDFSWAMTLEEVEEDLAFIAELPGTKVLLKGNHDYWWQSLTKLKKTYPYPKLHFLQNDCYQLENINICGTRGWICPGDALYTLKEEKTYLREIERLALSLQKANKDIPIVVMMHFPPMNGAFEPSGFTDLFKKYGVSHVLYGHVHGKDCFEQAPKGWIDHIHYQLVSADYLDFNFATLHLC